MIILPPTASATVQTAATKGPKTDAASTPATPTVKSAEAIAKALGLNAPQQMTATVVGSGRLSESLFTKVRPDTPAMPQVNASGIPAKPKPAHPQQSFTSGGDITAPAGPQVTSSAIKVGDIWLKLAIAKAGTLLLTLPSTPSAAIKGSNSPMQAPANMAQPPLAKGAQLSITLFPDGHIELPSASTRTLNAALGHSQRSGLISANLDPAMTRPRGPQRSVATTEHASATASATTATFRSYTPHLPAPSSATAMALSQLVNKLQHVTVTGSPMSLSQSSAAIQQLRDAVATATPTIQNQLLPTKLLHGLDTLRESLPSQSSPKDLATTIEKALGTAGPHPLITHMQQVLNTSQRLAQPHNTAPAILALLLKGLPSKSASHERIQESRANIAQWLSQELSTQIARIARQHAVAGQGAERQEPFQLQQELPIKLGDELTYMQLRIEERNPEQHNGNNNRLGAAPEEKRWSIFLTFDVPEALPPQTNDRNELNPPQTLPADTLSVEMTLIQQSVSVELWCQRKALFQQIQRELPSLEETMAESGLTLTQALCHQGKAPEKKTALTQTPINQKPLSQTRIDIKT